MLSCERSSIFLHDARTAEFWTKVALDSKEIRVPEKTGIVGAAFWANQLLDVPDPYSDSRFNPANDQRTGFRTRNILAAPVSGSDGKPLGVIQAINKKDGPFRDMHDLCLRVESRGMNKKLVESLVKAGAMDSLEGARSQKMAALDGAMESGQTMPASS